jgi:hypothetical protein
MPFQKTFLARKAYTIYCGRNSYLLLPYFFFLFSSFCIPVAGITYIYENFGRLFVFLIPVYLYVAFPVWLGATVTFYLMFNVFMRFFGQKNLIKAEDASFSDVIYQLFGFKLRDNDNGK